jgi:RHS repeat-associated protein
MARCAVGICSSSVPSLATQKNNRERHSHTQHPRWSCRVSSRDLRMLLVRNLLAPLIIFAAPMVLVNPAVAQTFVSNITINGGPLVGASTQTATGQVTIQRDPNDQGADFVSISGSATTFTCPQMSQGFCVIPAGSDSSSITVMGSYVNQTVVDTVSAYVIYVGPNNPQTTNVTVNPFVISLAVSPSSLVGGAGTTATGTITVTNATPIMGLTVNMDSGSLPVQIPPQVYIPANSTSANFQVLANSVVSQANQGTVSATLANTANTSMTVLPFQITVSLPGQIESGQPGEGTVTLSPSPANSLGVSLSATPGNLLWLPPTVNIGAGQSSGNFTFTGGTVTEPTPNVVTATYGASGTGNITVTPAYDPYLPCPCDGQEAQAGSPINLTNGNVWITQQDYSLPGLSGGLSLVRTWNSLWRSENPSPSSVAMFGDSWRSTYEEHLYVKDSTNIQYARANGDIWWFTWNSTTNSYYVLTPQNRYASMTFNNTTLLYTLTFSDGTTRAFNNNGYLTALTDRNGNKAIVSYDSSNRITTVTDAANRSITFSYTDANNPGQATSAQDSTGTIATYTYDVYTRLTKVSYADGSFLTFNFDPSLEFPITSVLDKLGKIVEAHTYDSSSRGLTSQRANGVDSVTVSYPSAGTTQLTDSLSNNTSFAYSVVGSVKLVSSVTGPTCHSCGAQVNDTFTFDSNGNKTSSTDALGNVTNYTYDAKGNVLTKAVHMADGTVPTWSYTYNSFGEVLTATDPLNHTTTNVYDTKGNLLSTTTPSPDGTKPGSTTTFTYNTNGTLKTIKDPLGNTTTLTYYSTGLVNTVKDANSKITTYNYDARGDRTSIIDPVNGSSKPTSFVYDSMSRLTSITYPNALSNPVQFGYDYRGRRTSVTDQNGKLTQYGYDDADRPISVTDAQTPTAGVTQYGYDTESNLTSITDALNRPPTTFTYNAKRQLTETQFPSGLQESYGYDADGNLTRKTDRKNQLITYGYDAQGRVTSKTYPDTTAVNYTYDLAGRLTQVTDPTGTYALAYDNMNRLTQAGSNYAFLTVGNLAVQYGYDAASNRTSMIDPQNLSTVYGYDVLNRLSTLAFNGQSPAFGFGYDALSRRTSLTRPNGITTTYAYNPASNLTSVLHKLGTTTLDGATYVVDNDGNRTSRTDKRLDTTLTYTYDPIYQLLTAKQGSTTKETYTYDLVGNRLSSLGVSPYSYNSSNELTTLPSGSYTYDSNGNTLTKPDGTQFTWDFENRLTKVVLPGTGGTVNFKYDPFGRRIQKSFVQGSTTTTTNYVYDGPNLLEEVDQNGNVLARYTQGRRIDEPLAELRSGTNSYYEQDGVDSVTSLSNSAGALANTYTYDSFGRSTSSNGTITNSLQYTGRELDAETGLYFNRFRYYDSNVGRFLNEDPITFDGGVDFYRYLGNSPTGAVDSFGLSSICSFPSGCGPRPSPPPMPNPIPNAIAGAYAAYLQCVSPNPISGCYGPKNPHIPIPKPDFQDDFGDKAVPDMSVGPLSTELALSTAKDCLRQHPLAALDPRFNDIEPSDMYPLF